MNQCSLTANELLRIYECRVADISNLRVGGLFKEYIKYLYLVDEDLWDASTLANEFGLHHNVIIGVIGKKKYIADRRDLKDRRSGDRRNNGT